MASPAYSRKIKETDEQPKMSEAATLGNIFFSPGETLKICAASRVFCLPLC
jgi:hypothetical protein